MSTSGNIAIGTRLRYVPYSGAATEVGEITNAAQLQLQLTRDVVLAVERISEVAKTSRARAEEACWTTNTLTKLLSQFNNVLAPLRDAHPGHAVGHDYPITNNAIAAPMVENTSDVASSSYEPVPSA